MEGVLLSTGVELNGSRMELNDPRRMSRSSTSNGLVFKGILTPKRDAGEFTRDEPIPDQTDQSPSFPSSRVTINICGRRFDVPVATLSKHPETLLGNAVKMNRFYDPERKEYFFNRNRSCFESILQYYQSGILRRPVNSPLDTFVAEARFFELGHDAFLQFCRDEGFEREEPESLPTNPVLRKIWQFVEMPQSSIAAKIFAIFSMLVIVLSIIVFCLETLPQFHGPRNNETEQKNYQVAKGYAVFAEPLYIIESICIAWFTLEFIVRLISCPNKKQFFKSPLNIIDLIAIIPYYVDLGITLSSLANGDTSHMQTGSLAVLRILRLVRVFRLFKISRHSKGLQILGKTFAMSLHEMGLLLLFLGIGVVLFSSAVYYAELGTHDTQFTSIPDGFWWAVVTMTTVGYGDICPKGAIGKLIGTACAVSGLIAIALPVPVIVANFNTIYQREKERPYVEEVLSEKLLYRSSESLYRQPSETLIYRPNGNSKLVQNSSFAERQSFVIDRD
ncbi:Potassium voltage-gated channel subfamily A member 1 [Hypsibius exemplaris]|uniref:Potassium voltage-gated channel subfamily A member 1 n=1 Tax=Hypsibius exemplaris TaxID=2072580 RepID=A0A1W0X668_HYPEX|nr:Potassium voltage-gated channel subfamily A member 1 [Hypsibius exemplaris]